MNSLTFTNQLLGMQSEMRAFAFKLTSNREDAEDLLQDTSIKVLDNAAKYATDTNFKGWVYTIMRHIFINNYRRIVRERTFADATAEGYYLNRAQGEPHEDAEHAYDLREVSRVVGRLPKEFRKPFAMHVAGFKYREIAQQLRIPLGTVKSRIYVTRQRLQQLLKDFR